MALTANRELDRFVDQELRTFPVGSAVQIYKGALVGMAPAGVVRSLVAGDRFLGVAYEEADNSSGASGDQKIRVYTSGDFVLPLTGVATSDLLKKVYATADNTISLTAGPKSSFVGYVIGVHATNYAVVRLAGLGTLPADDLSLIHI